MLLTERRLDPKLIGVSCIADNQWYGRYKGIIMGEMKQCKSDSLRVWVQIIECLREPSSLPECVINGNNPYNLFVRRRQYEPWETQHFDIKEVSICE